MDFSGKSVAELKVMVYDISRRAIKDQQMLQHLDHLIEQKEMEPSDLPSNA